MLKTSSANKNKEKKSNSEIKISKKSVESSNNPRPETDSKKKKISTEDRYYNSLNQRNGFQSVDNRKIKRRSNAKNKFTQNEFTVDVKKLDQTVNEIWGKFVMYYDYDKIFSWKMPQEEKEKILKKEIDFDLKLQTLFNIYKIKKAGDSYNLISDSEEGSYILKHAKIWIIYLKNLIEKLDLKFKETHQIFNFALEYDADEHLLFDYFITVSREFDEEEVMEYDENMVPEKFVRLYNENKELILKTLKEEDEVEINFGEKNSKQVQLINQSKEEICGDNQNEFEVNRDNTDNPNDKKEKINEIQNGELDENDCNENEHDFSFNIKTITELTDEVINEQESEKILQQEVIIEQNLNSSKSEEVVVSQDNPNDESLKSYLITNKPSVEDDQEGNKNEGDTILEESREDESVLSVKNINHSDIKHIQDPEDVININLETPLKTNLNSKEVILLTSISKRKNDNSLKKLIFGKNFPSEYEEAKLVEPNLRNSGNFAVLELLSKSQEKLGHKYVLTPLKKEILTNKKEYEEADKDLAEIHKNYPDFIYQPYDDDLRKKISKKTSDK